jgi:hypothetical protein
MRLEGLGQLRKSNDLIGTQTRDPPACIIVPQPTTLPRAPLEKNPFAVYSLQLFVQRVQNILTTVMCNRSMLITG